MQCIGLAAQNLRKPHPISQHTPGTDLALAISELELAIMGFVRCAVVTNILRLYRPFVIEYSIFINCPSRIRDQIISRLCATVQATKSADFLSPSWEDFKKEERIRSWASTDYLGLGKYRCSIFHYELTWLKGRMA